MSNGHKECLSIYLFNTIRQFHYIFSVYYFLIFVRSRFFMSNQSTFFPSLICDLNLLNLCKYNDHIHISLHFSSSLTLTHLSRLYFSLTCSNLLHLFLFYILTHLPCPYFSSINWNFAISIITPYSLIFIIHVFLQLIRNLLWNYFNISFNKIGNEFSKSIFLNGFKTLMTSFLLLP